MIGAIGAQIGLAMPGASEVLRVGHHSGCWLGSPTDWGERSLGFGRLLVRAAKFLALHCGADPGGRASTKMGSGRGINLS